MLQSSAHDRGVISRGCLVALILAVVMPAVAIALLAEPAGAVATAEPAPYAVTLDLSASEVAAGGAVTYAGSVQTAAGAPAAGAVTVQKRRADGGSWSSWRTTTLSPSGAYSITVKMTTADRVWQFRARMAGDGAASLTGTSAVAQLRVAALAAPCTVTLDLSASEVAAGGAVTYAGSVQTAAGAPAAGAVTVQKRRADGGSWSSWRTTTLSPSGAYSITVKMTTADRVWQFRARMAGDGSNLVGYSELQTLAVAGYGHPEVVKIAQRYLGVPYLWGGAGPAGFDCSGLTAYCYAQVGVGLSHGATDQQHASMPVSLTDLRSGDLVFFGDASYSYHVGIYVGDGQMIDAPHTGAVVGYDSISGAWIGGRF